MVVEVTTENGAQINSRAISTWRRGIETRKNFQKGKDMVTFPALQCHGYPTIATTVV
jgi:hypothetical protein